MDSEGFPSDDYIQRGLLDYIIYQGRRKDGGKDLIIPMISMKGVDLLNRDHVIEKMTMF
jgi:hypothetical protein